MVQSINRNRAPEDIAQQIQLAKLIAEQQQAVATGQRVTKPSDDPQAWLEISTLARFQSDDAAWTGNIGRAETRASQAEASFDALSNGLIRIKELLIQASTGSTTPQDRAGLALEVQGLLADFSDILGQRDNFGGPLFRDGPAIAVPIGNERQVVASPNMDAVRNSIDIGGGVVLSLDQIVASVADAMANGTEADRTAQFDPLDAAIDHMTGLLTVQGVARDTLEQARVQLGDNKLALADRRSQLEDADVTEAISRLQAMLVSLEAAQAVYSRVSQRTLFDYLG